MPRHVDTVTVLSRTTVQIGPALSALESRVMLQSAVVTHLPPRQSWHLEVSNVRFLIKTLKKFWVNFISTFFLTQFIENEYGNQGTFKNPIFFRNGDYSYI